MPMTMNNLPTTAAGNDGLHLPTTKADGKLQSACDLLSLASRMDDATVVLREVHSVLNDSTSTKMEKKLKLVVISKTIIPLLLTASGTIKASAQLLSPVGGIGYVHNRMENKRKREIIDKNSPTSEPEQQIRTFVQDNIVEPPRKERRVRPVTPTIGDVSALLPVPAKGRGCAYNKAEVAAILSKINRRSQEYTQLKSDIIKYQKDVGAPCSERTIARIMERHNDGLPIIGEFTMRGQPAICTDADIKQLVDTFEERTGQVRTAKDVAEIITDLQTDKLQQQGIVDIVKKQPSKTTVRNYFALMASQRSMSIVESSITKSSIRVASENSWRAAVSFTAVVGATHVLLRDKWDPDILHDLKHLPKPTVELTLSVSKAWGDRPVLPVKPAYIYSTDETTNYAYEGTRAEKGRFVLVTKKSVAKSGTQAMYNCDDNKSMSGMRLKCTFTFSALGACFPLVVTVAGLKDSEMPEKDFVHVTVPGLCVGGGGVNVNNTEDGHIVFLRNDPGAEKKKFRWYQDTILIPGINAQRLHHDNFDASKGLDIPDALTAVSWCDGDLSQIDAITNSIPLFAENKIVANKQHAARSGVEQPADVSRVFKQIKQLINTTSNAHLPVERCPIKKLLSEAISEDLSCIKLASNKRGALIDFISILPEVATKACTKSNIQHGFIESGIIDKDNHRYPVFNKMLATCRRNPTQDEYNIAKSNFPDFLYSVEERGLIPEEQYEMRGIQVDKDAHGNEVRRDYEISLETRQRSKCLTNSYQVRLREEQRAIATMRASRQKSEEELKRQELINMNNSCVDVLTTNMMKEGLLNDTDLSAPPEV